MSRIVTYVHCLEAAAEQLIRKRQPDDTLRLTGDSGETGATE